jgi:Leucine-rich repeat (LRR) protein
VDTAAVALPAVAALPSSVAAPSLHRPERAAPSLSAYKATRDAALAADKQVRKAKLEARMAALNATGPTGPACNATTTFYYMGYDANVDLSPCHQSLTELVILSVDFALIAPQIKHMVNLQLLKIYYTWNTFLPEELADLKQLTQLEVYTGLMGWPAVLQRMPQLRHLALSGASLYSLPPWLGKLRNLVYLDIAHNYIYEIGDEIGDLVNLENFIAPFSNVYNLSPRINRLTHLRHLDLRYSYYLRLPATLAELNELESVELEGSYYPCVPDAVRAMPVMADAHYFDNTPSCAAVPQPIGYAQTRNEACLWDAYYGFWYKAACDGKAC